MKIERKIRYLDKVSERNEKKSVSVEYYFLPLFRANCYDCFSCGGSRL